MNQEDKKILKKFEEELKYIDLIGKTMINGKLVWKEGFKEKYKELKKERKNYMLWRGIKF